MNKETAVIDQNEIRKMSQGMQNIFVRLVNEHQMLNQKMGHALSVFKDVDINITKNRFNVAKDSLFWNDFYNAYKNIFPADFHQNIAPKIGELKNNDNLHDQMGAMLTGLAQKN